MRKAFTAVLAAIMCASAAPAREPVDLKQAYHSRVSFALPPARFTGDNITLVIFATDVSQFCGEAPAGLVILGCQRMTNDGAPVLILPNPNRTILTPAGYQRLVAHELGHRNGWSGDHEL